MHRHTVLCCAFAAPSTLAAAPLAAAQSFAILTADAMARLLGAKISQRWGVPVVVENRLGASGIIGTDAVAKAAPDGYTLLFTATNHGTLAALNPKLPYETIKSFAPVMLLGIAAT